MSKKIVSVLLALTVMVACLVGCNKSDGNPDGKVSIKIGSWPGEGSVESTIEKYENRLEAMNKAYPNIEILKDTTAFDVKSFAIKASSGQLPNLYTPHYTEVAKIVNSGYAKDLTDFLEEKGYIQNLNPALTELLTIDGKIWAVPETCSVQGLSCNKALFKEAGLVDENGIPIFPKTYEELAQTAVTIKQKTGKAGIVICSNKNQGGWYFSMMAMGFGVNFVEAKGDKYIAAFNTPEFREALQYIYDLKWKYDVLPDNAFIDRIEQRKLFATNQAAMTFDYPPCDPYVIKYGMNKDDVCFCRVPSGKGGRVSLIGGVLYMVSPETTDEQLDAIFKWIDISGQGPHINDDIEKSLEEEYASTAAEGRIVTSSNMMDIWVNSDIVKKQKELRSKYNNVNDANFEDYFSFEDVIIKPEVSPCAQQLYTILDGGIQEILTNKNVNIDKLATDMCSDFQVNHLDKWED